MKQIEWKLDELFVNGAVTVSASDFAAMARRAGSISPRLSSAPSPPKAASAPEISLQKAKTFSIDSNLPSSGSLLSENPSCTSLPPWEDDVGGDGFESDGSDQPFATNAPPPTPISESGDFPVRKRTQIAKNKIPPCMLKCHYLRKFLQGRKKSFFSN